MGAGRRRGRTACSCVDYPYFERAEPLVWDEGGTYVETDAEFTHTRHARVEPRARRDRHRAARRTACRSPALVEHDTVPWDALPGLMERLPDEEWRLIDRPWRLAASYTLQARRPR